MPRRLWFLGLLALWLGGVSLGADRSPDSGQLTVLAAPWGQVYCSKGCSFSADPQGRVTVTTPSGKVMVARTDEWTILQFPNQTTRVRTYPDGTLLVQFENKNYRISRQHREIQLKLPDDTVTYSLMDGTVRTILGKAGQVRIARGTERSIFKVSSPAGDSAFQVKASLAPKVKGKAKRDRLLKLVKVDGPNPDQHPYLYRGLRFEDQGVGLYIPLNAGPLLASLPWKNALIFQATPPPAAGPAPSPTPDGPSDPLKAQTGEGDVLKAQSAKPGEDPLKAQQTSNDVLKATPGKTGEDPLKLKSKPNDLKYDMEHDPLQIKEPPAAQPSPSPEGSPKR